MKLPPPGKPVLIMDVMGQDGVWHHVSQSPFVLPSAPIVRDPIYARLLTWRRSRSHVPFTNGWFQYGKNGSLEY